jgi:hypothetical protein
MGVTTGRVAMALMQHLEQIQGVNLHIALWNRIYGKWTRIY